MNKIYIIVFVVIILLLLYFVLIRKTHIKTSSEITEIKPPTQIDIGPPIILEEEKPPVIFEEEKPIIVVCPENDNSYYTFLPEVQLGKDILDKMTQVIKMFIRPIREMFVPLVNIITDPTKMSPDKKYIIGDINNTGSTAISNANLQAKNGGTICTATFPSKIYFELKQPSKNVTDFCNSNFNTYYPTTKNVTINLGDSINQNLVNIAPNTVDTCMYDIMYNYNGNIPYGKVGRYIVIYLQFNKVESYINLVELQAFDWSNNNVALRKPVVMSSTLTGYPGSNLVDGNLNTLAHTNNNCPWIYVDLGSDISLKNIKVFNRADCCQSRIVGFRIGLISSSDFNTMLSALQKPVTIQYPVISSTGIPTSTLSTVSVLNVVIPSTILKYSGIFNTQTSLEYNFNLA